MASKLYPFLSAILANILAQALKPVFHYIKTGKVELKLFFESGGFPSSHTSMVVALTLALGLQTNFYSEYFFIAFIFSLTVIYDAANVRYYAGQNIKVTKQLIQDIEKLTQTKLDNPVYRQRIKDVLGHQWIEVLGGIAVGLLTALILFWIVK